MNELDTIKSAIIRFYNDPLYQELNAYYSKKTIFNILKIERNENRHSAFLAWLLDKNVNHGLGDEPLKKLLRFLYIRNEVNSYDSCLLSGNYLIDKLEVSTEEQAYDSKKYGRIDIFLKLQYRYHTRDEQEKRLCVIIENKMYTEEHDNQTERYRDWALRQKYEKEQIIGVFLAPNRVGKCTGDNTPGFEFLKIDYQDLLDNVLEPLLLLDMPQDAKVFITDYIINLGQPLQKTDDNGAVKEQTGTILAVPNKTKEKVYDLYKKHKDFLDALVCAKNSGKKDLLTELFKDRYPSIQPKGEVLPLLRSFWENKNNKSLLKIILDISLNLDYEGCDQIIAKLLELNESNRDNTKYLVFAADGTLMNENGKPASKSLASYYIFKAWLDKNENATIDEIRAAFPVESILDSDKYPYDYLFYWFADVMNAIKQGSVNKPKNKDAAYFTKTSLDSKNETHKFLNWDFYVNGNHCLSIYNEETDKIERVLSMKDWDKVEFGGLKKYACEHYRIRVEEAQ